MADNRADEGVRAQPEPSLWARRLRRFGYAESARTDTRDLLVPPFPEPGTRVWEMLGLGPALSGRLARWSGWLGPLLVSLFAGVIRFWHLGNPRDVVFDETYYAKDAWALLKYGYEGTWPDGKISNPQILAHPQVIPVTNVGSYVVHPPAGKWIIAAGEWMFGLNPFGWRFMMAVLGTLSVLMLCRIGRRLFRSTALGCIAGLLMSVDGLHYVMSRIALLDLVIMFFALAAFGCLLVDRDWSRARLAAALPVGEDGFAGPDDRAGSRTGMGWRPWRIAAAVMLGLAAASKWNGLYFLAFFTLLTVLWDVGSRRVAGARRPRRAVLRRDLGWSLLTMIPVALGTYLLTWTGWFMSSNGYGRHWADHRGGTWSFIPAPLRSLWHYEYQVYQFNVNLHAGHPYQSNPWSWLVLGRPVSYYFESPKVRPGRLQERRRLLAGDPGAGHAAAVVGGVLRAAVPALPVGHAPRLAGGRHPLRGGRRLPALVPLPGPYDLLLLRRRLRAVPVPGGHDDDRGVPGAAPGEREPPDVGRGRRGHPRAAHRVELHLLLPDLHGDDDPLLVLAGQDVAGLLDLSGRSGPPGTGARRAVRDGSAGGHWAVRRAACERPGGAAGPDGSDGPFGYGSCGFSTNPCPD